jgi:hypothetical protein
MYIALAKKRKARAEHYLLLATSQPLPFLPSPRTCRFVFALSLRCSAQERRAASLSQGQGHVLGVFGGQRLGRTPIQRCGGKAGPVHLWIGVLPKSPFCYGTDDSLYLLNPSMSDLLMSDTDAI